MHHTRAFQIIIANYVSCGSLENESGAPQYCLSFCNIVCIPPENISFIINNNCQQDQQSL